LEWQGSTTVVIHMLPYSDVVEKPDRRMCIRQLASKRDLTDMQIHDALLASKQKAVRHALVSLVFCPTCCLLVLV